MLIYEYINLFTSDGEWLYRIYWNIHSKRRTLYWTSGEKKSAIEIDEAIISFWLSAQVKMLHFLFSSRRRCRRLLNTYSFLSWFHKNWLLQLITFSFFVLLLKIDLNKRIHVSFNDISLLQNVYKIVFFSNFFLLVFCNMFLCYRIEQRRMRKNQPDNQYNYNISK